MQIELSIIEDSMLPQRRNIYRKMICSLINDCRSNEDSEVAKYAAVLSAY